MTHHACSYINQHRMCIFPWQLDCIEDASLTFRWEYTNSISARGMMWPPWCCGVRWDHCHFQRKEQATCLTQICHKYLQFCGYLTCRSGSPVPDDLHKSGYVFCKSVNLWVRIQVTHKCTHAQPYSLFYNIMYKYKALPPSIDHLFSHHSITLKLRINLEHRCSWLTSLKLYIDLLYITYNLYIEWDSFALSWLRTWAMRNLRGKCFISELGAAIKHIYDFLNNLQKRGNWDWGQTHKLG